MNLVGLTFGYTKRQPILEGVDLQLKGSDMVGLLGINGAGKTTLLKIIAGVIQPDAGTVTVDGVVLDKKTSTEHKRSVGYMPETVDLYPDMTTRDVLAYLARLKGVVHANIDDTLEAVGLQDYRHRNVRHLSKGLKQRLNFAQAIIGKPRVLVFDEPSNGFDAAGVEMFYRVLRDLAAEGAMMILASHQFVELQHSVDQIALLTDGRIVRHDTVDALMAQIGNGERRIWIGCKEIVNLEKMQHCGPDDVHTSTDGRILTGVFEAQQITDIFIQLRAQGNEVESIRVEGASLSELLSERFIA